jgi:hypothetical protein
LNYFTQTEQAIEKGILHPRWRPLPVEWVSHPKLNAYLLDDSRRIMVTAGRRSGKTEIAKRKLVIQALTCPNTSYLILAPTLFQCKTIYWNDPELNIVDFFPPYTIKKISDSQLRIELINGSIIQLGSADSINRYLGVQYHGILIDECGDISELKELIERHLNGLVLKTDGWMYFIGVPKQTLSTEYKEMWNRFSDNSKHPHWHCYTWSSEEVIEKQLIQKLKAEMDIQTYQEEYLGTFSTGYGGLAYSQFDESIHVTDYLPFDQSLPVCATIDFNTKIMPISIAQVTNDNFINVVDESVTRHTNLYTAIPALKKKLIDLSNGDEKRAKERPLFLYGDHTGHNGSVGVRGSFWTEVSQMLQVDGWNYEIRTKANPLFDKKVSAVNGRLRTADGNVHMRISSKAQELIKDLKFVSYSDLKLSKEKLEKASL